MLVRVIAEDQWCVKLAENTTCMVSPAGDMAVHTQESLVSMPKQNIYWAGSTLKCRKISSRL